MRRRVRVQGRVQGVAFRAYTQQEARRAGLAGWVRNASDGSVEAVFEGPPASVEALVVFCRRGPPAARVDGVEVSEEAPQGLSGFEIR